MLAAGRAERRGKRDLHRVGHHLQGLDLLAGQLDLVADLRLGFSPGLWRDFTINTIVPAASEEKYEQGLFLLDYGPLRTGEPLVVKIDGQINPVFAMLNRGEIALFDGDRRLASLPLEVRVLP